MERVGCWADQRHFFLRFVPAASVYLPAEQAVVVLVQSVLMVVSGLVWYLPVAHGVHVVSVISVPATAVYLPFGQTVVLPAHAFRTVVSAAAWNLPVTHVVHTVSALALEAVAVNSPLAHSLAVTQLSTALFFLEAAALNLPVAHAVQTVLAVSEATVAVYLPFAQSLAPAGCPSRSPPRGSSRSSPSRARPPSRGRC